LVFGTTLLISVSPDDGLLLSIAHLIGILLAYAVLIPLGVYLGLHGLPHRLSTALLSIPAAAASIALVMAVWIGWLLSLPFIAMWIVIARRTAVGIGDAADVKSGLVAAWRYQSRHTEDPGLPPVLGGLSGAVVGLGLGMFWSFMLVFRGAPVPAWATSLPVPTLLAVFVFIGVALELQARRFSLRSSCFAGAFASLLAAFSGLVVYLDVLSGLLIVAPVLIAGLIAPALAHRVVNGPPRSTV
jgi:hypothetical protein